MTRTNKAQLRDLMADCKRAGAITTAMWAAFDDLLADCLSHLQHLPYHADICQAARLRFHANWRRVDPKRNVRAYLIGLIRSCASTTIRSEKAHNHKFPLSSDYIDRL